MSDLDPLMPSPQSDKKPDGESQTDSSDQQESGSQSPAENEDSKKTPLSVIFAGILITILTIVFLKVDNWGRDWTNNTAETSPDSTDENMRPVDAQLTTEEFAALIQTSMSEVPRWKLQSTDDSSKERIVLNYIHLTFLMRFKDDVTVEVVKTKEGARMYAKSQSRIGKGDLGQNPRNIRELVSTVRKELED